jgi:hypothetical protein
MENAMQPEKKQYVFSLPIWDSTYVQHTRKIQNTDTLILK